MTLAPLGRDDDNGLRADLASSVLYRQSHAALSSSQPRIPPDSTVTGLPRDPSSLPRADRIVDELLQPVVCTPSGFHPGAMLSIE